MPRWTFGCTGGQSYKGDNTQLVSTDYHAGQSSFAPEGNRRSIVLFDSASIRNVLSTQYITACYLSFKVTDTYFTTGAVAIIGTHNYTSIPTTWSSSRVTSDRLRYGVTEGQQVTELNIGTTIGEDFKNGTATGIAFGPGIDESYNWTMSVSPDGTATEPVLIIDTVSFNSPPYAPSLVSPTEGSVLDVANFGVTFQWTHRDPNANPQAHYFLSRKLPNGTIQYWNNTTQLWQGTSIRNAGSSQSLALTPAKWASSASGRYEWRVATSDFEPLDGPYSSWRSFWQSIPPTIDVTEPGTTITTQRSTVRWIYADVDGDPQYAWVFKIYHPNVYNQPGFNSYIDPNFVGQSYAYNNATSGIINFDLVNHQTYRLYAWTASSPNPTKELQLSTPKIIELLVTIPPFAPLITYPRNGSIVDLAVGFTLTWENNHYGGEGTQAGFAIRRLNQSGVYHWWSGSAWVTVETFLSGMSPAYTFRLNEVPNGTTYTFSVRMRDSYGQQSPYSSGTTVTGSSAAQVTVLSPPNTVVVINPIVTWSVYDAENDPQQTYQVRIIHSSVYSGGIPNPGTATAVWDSGVVSSSTVRNVTVPLDLGNNNSYRAYVRVQTGGVLSGWSYAEFIVLITPPAIPSAELEIDEEFGAIDIIVQGRDSMLGIDVARGVSGWSALTNCTVAQAVQYESAETNFIVNLTATTAATMSARLTTTIDAQPFETYTGAATLIVGPGDIGVSAYVSLQFLNASNAQISVVNGNTVNDTSALRSSVTTESPASTAKVRLYITFLNIPSSADVHGFFDPVIRPGEGNEWSPGGLAGTAYASVIENNDERVVRKGLNVPLLLPLQRALIRDEEPPIGKNQNYRITVKTTYEDLVLISDTLITETIVWTSGWVWISDPLRSNSSRSFGPQGFDATTRPARQGVFRPIGRADAIVVKGTRSLREGSFTIVTHSRAERESYTDLVVNSGTILLRIPPDQGDSEGETIYVQLIGDIPEERPLASRTVHRTISQAWIEQVRPEDNLEYADNASGLPIV